jgi:hypothetical protein
LGGSLLVVAVAVDDRESGLLFSVPIRIRVTSIAQVHLQKGLIAVTIREMPESLTGRPTKTAVDSITERPPARLRHQLNTIAIQKEELSFENDCSGKG